LNPPRRSCLWCNQRSKERMVVRLPAEEVVKTNKAIWTSTTTTNKVKRAIATVDLLCRLLVYLPY